jgi:hypothetical protein
MYSQNEIDEAVAAGAISAHSATALRAFIEGQRSSSVPDEEHFRLITGFNDIFVSVAAAILLVAVGWIGQWIGESAGLRVGGDGPSPLLGLFVAASAWGLALFFTAKRRMALPSILLLLAFVGGTLLTAATTIGLALGEDAFRQNEALFGVAGAASAAIAAGAAWMHWKRFCVPITVATGAAATAGIAVGILLAVLGERIETMETDPRLRADARRRRVPVRDVVGWLGPARITRRSDVAFWLHLLAAPMIVHPVFTAAWPQRRRCDASARGFVVSCSTSRSE